MESGGSSEMMNISMYTHVYQCRKLRFVRYVFCVSLCLILLCMPAHTYKNGWYRWQKMVCVCAYVWACGCRFLLMYCKSCSTYNINIVYWPLCCLCTIHIVLSHCWWGQQKQHLYTQTHLSITFFSRTLVCGGVVPLVREAIIAVWFQVKGFITEIANLMKQRSCCSLLLLPRI